MLSVQQETAALIVLSYSHDVGFVDGRHTASLVVSGVFEGVLCDASAGVLGDQFDALNDAINDLQQQERRDRSFRRDARSCRKELFMEV